jgi:hypothetical protein
MSSIYLGHLEFPTIPVLTDLDLKRWADLPVAHLQCSVVDGRVGWQTLPSINTGRITITNGDRLYVLIETAGWSTGKAAGGGRFGKWLREEIKLFPPVPEMQTRCCTAFYTEVSQQEQMDYLILVSQEISAIVSRSRRRPILDKINVAHVCPKLFREQEPA